MYININDDLKLKILRPEDAGALFDLTDRNRDHLKKWLPWLDFTTKESDTLNFIKMTMKQFGENQGLQMGIWQKEKIAGVVGHHKISWANKSTSLGYWLGKDFSGQGIMTNACKAIIDFSFNELSLNRIEIAAATGNKKSRAIPERLGFSLDGTLRESEWLYDKYVDHAVYSILVSEWKTGHC